MQYCGPVAALSQALLQGGHEQLASLSQPAATVVTLAKRRRQHGSMAVTTEETELQVMPSTRLNADQRGPTANRTAAAAFFDGPPADQAAAEAVLPAEGEAFEAWRSVAIEGKRKACTSLLATVPAACRAATLTRRGPYPRRPRGPLGTRTQRSTRARAAPSARVGSVCGVLRALKS